MTTTQEVASSLVFDRYKAIRRLAVGGMGEIFLARQVVGLDRLVILKSLLPHLAQDADAVNQFINEARVAATLNHPNIVSIYDVGSWRDVHYIVMEYIAGEHLGQVMQAIKRQGKYVPPQFVLQIIRDALNALDFAHHAKNADGQVMTVIHRDVSPQNIMIREDGVVKVVDFGIARADSLAARTKTGMVRGKLPYMAPELLRGAPATTRSDQYAIGVIAWEMLTGERLFAGSNDAAITTAIVEGKVPAPSTMREEITSDVDHWVLTMLASDADQRYERCATAARVATSIAAGLSDPSDENSVAKYISEVIGGSVAERTANLTPTREDVLNHQITRTSVATAAPTRKVASKGKINRALLLACLALGLSAIAFGVVTVRNQKQQRVAAAAELGEVAAPAVTGRLVLDSEPPGATVVVGESYLGATPLTLETLPADVLHTLRLTLRDHQPLNVDVRLAPGEERHIHVDLAAISKVASGQGGEPARPPVKQATPAPRPAAKARSVKAAAPPPAPVVEDATLTIRTKPWTNVSIDGRSRGVTPLSKIALGAGSHTVVFDNPEAKIHRTQKVVLKGGENQKLDLNLTE